MRWQELEAQVLHSKPRHLPRLNPKKTRKKTAQFCNYTTNNDSHHFWGGTRVWKCRQILHPLWVIFNYGCRFWWLQTLIGEGLIKNNAFPSLHKLQKKLLKVSNFHWQNGPLCVWILFVPTSVAHLYSVHHIVVFTQSLRPRRAAIIET